MANIRSFDTPALGLTPTETGIDATVQGARRSASLLSQAGEDIAHAGSSIGSGIKVAGDIAVKQIEHEEVTRGAANFAQMSADLTQKWNDTVKNADPNNPAVAAKFREEVLEPQLEKYTGTFNTEGGQKFADSHVAALRNHMFEKTAADMSTLAGIAVRKNINDSTTAMSNTAISDPSSVPFLLKTADSQIDAVVGSSPTLSAVDAARAKGELSDTTKKAIVQYGAIGAIQKSGNPEATADEWIKKYPEYISGAEAKTLASNARQQIRANNYDFETNRRREKEIATDKSNGKVDQYLVDVRSQDPKLANDPTAKKILNDPDLLPAAKNNLLNYIDRQLKPEKVVTDPAIASSIDSRMFATDNPTSKMDILQAEASGKLSRADGDVRSKIIDERDKMPSDPMFKIAMDGAKQMIEGRTAGEKSLQAGKYASFMQQFLSDYQRQKAAGTLPPNALSLRDPNSLLSKTMEAYKSPLAAAIGGNGGIGAAPPPRNDVMPAIPAPDQRAAGSIYQTPRGPLKWTGTGWVQP